MRNLPILFSGSMVLALLAGRKTQTRRVIDFPGVDQVVDFVRVGFDKDTGVPFYEMKGAGGEFLTRPRGKNFVDHHFSARYAAGDRLYVREAWRTTDVLDALPPREIKGTENQYVDYTPIRYEADGATLDYHPLSDPDFGKERRGMHMPRWASRLTLIVTDIRVQRLQEISRGDAIAEGIQQFGRFYAVEADDDWDDAATDPREAYGGLWQKLNEARGFGWYTNPWVVAYSFSVHRQHIDQVSV